jgi:hypothetical protein
MDRRNLLKLGAATIAAGVQPALKAAAPAPAASIEQWGLFEISLPGPSTGNPYKEVTLTATFSLEHRTQQVTGFYDGEGTYRIRFSPDAQGHWTYTTASSAPQLANKTGAFTCIPPSPDNHGPVTVTREFHFQYEDGTPYFPFGTTTYAYLFTAEKNYQNSLDGMIKTRFNKTRICLLPKNLGGDVEAQPLPFPRTNKVNDLTRFNPTYFQMVEKRILDLQKNGIQADLILFHPYDSWGYKTMGAEADDFYLNYAIARLSAYRNVWWSVANEYDLIKTKTMSDWDRYFRIILANDPYSRLRSIHHSGPIYDNSKYWVTHASLQKWDFDQSAIRRAAWRKPIIYDELQYEGDIASRWGNLSAEEMTRRFWLAVIYGTYPTHGEVFNSEPGARESSWSDAGRLRGESGPRIAFMRDTIEKLTKTGFNVPEVAYYLNASDVDGTILYYFDFHRPARYDFPLPTTHYYTATLIDPFNMTTTPVSGKFSGKSTIQLPNKPYQAIVFQRAGENHDKTTEAAKPQVLD